MFHLGRISMTFPSTQQVQANKNKVHGLPDYRSTPRAASTEVMRWECKPPPAFFFCARGSLPSSLFARPSQHPRTSRVDTSEADSDAMLDLLLLLLLLAFGQENAACGGGQ
jgi:hypothetical protein